MPGCGEGGEAIWLATEGWQVTAADISTESISRAFERATKSCASPERVQWVEADLSVWEPGQQFDLVTTHYAHPAMPQLAFYERISGWVAPGGTLLIVGHLLTSETPGNEHSQERDGHGHNPPEEASVTAASITVGLDVTQWDIVTADEPIRTLTDRAGRTMQLDDVVVRASRRP
jgi:cyclopropane fatty-acyl-phospholipid synthase-like methyltransferase